MRQPETDTIIIQTNRAEGADKSSPAQATVYFDGACPLCTAEIDHYRAQDDSENMSFVDVSESDVELGPELDAEVAMRRFHIRSADGMLVSGARALSVIWQTLPGWHWAARFAHIPGVTPALEAGYRMFLPIRSLLSKLASWFGTKTTLPHRSTR